MSEIYSVPAEPITVRVLVVKEKQPGIVKSRGIPVHRVRKISIIRIGIVPREWIRILVLVLIVVRRPKRGVAPARIAA